jgi:hypothetical protein
VGATPSHIVFSIGVTNALNGGETITITSTEAIFVDAVTSSCSAAGVDAFSSMTTSTTVIVLHAPSSGISAGGKVITCTGSQMAVNAAIGTKPMFTATSTQNTATSASDNGYTILAGRSLTWTSAMASDIFATRTPASITFSIGVTDALYIHDTITMSSSEKIWANASVTACNAVGLNGISAATSSQSELVITAPASGIGTGARVFTCAGGLAPNAAAGTIVTFTVVSSTSTSPLAGQTGYTIVAAPSFAPSAAPTYAPTTELYAFNEAMKELSLFFVISLSIASVLVVLLIAAVFVLIVFAVKVNGDKKLAQFQVESAQKSEAQDAPLTGSMNPMQRARSRGVEMVSLTSNANPMELGAEEKRRSARKEWAAKKRVRSVERMASRQIRLDTESLGGTKYDAPHPVQKQDVSLAAVPEATTWLSHMDDARGKTYYSHPVTGEVKWKLPTGGVAAQE